MPQTFRLRAHVALQLEPDRPASAATRDTSIVLLARSSTTPSKR